MEGRGDWKMDIYGVRFGPVARIGRYEKYLVIIDGGER